MPDNTWYTPYLLPNEDCLSIAASQGVAYRLSENYVLKMPYQYPVKDVESSDIDEAVEQLELSQCSIDSFKDERAFYQSLAKAGHHGIVQADVSMLEYGIVLEYLQPLEQCWYVSSVECRHRWTRQLMRANAKIEELGYTHGDLAIRNMGVDKNNDLKLFDFGSVHQHSDEGSQSYIERDISRLASCLHFLLSGKDPLANVADLQSLRRVESALRDGTFEVDVLARPIESTLKLCWSQDLTAIGLGIPSMVFRYLEIAILQALDNTNGPESVHRAALDQLSERVIGKSETQNPNQLQPALSINRGVVTPNSRWMAEEQYREAWKIKGIIL